MSSSFIQLFHVKLRILLNISEQYSENAKLMGNELKHKISFING